MRFGKWMATATMCMVAAGWAVSGLAQDVVSSMKATTAPVATTSAAPATTTSAPRAATVPVDLSLFDAKVYKDKDGREMPYRLLKPDNYDPKTKYPLVLVLHGGGGQGNDNIKHMGSVEMTLSKPELKAKFPCFSVAPQCPAGASWSGMRRPTSGSTTSSGPVAASTPATTSAPVAPDLLQMVMGILDKTRQDYSIDPARIYVTGVSMGGYGTWAVIARYPGLFAAAVPVCGGGDVAMAKTIADAKLPLWVWHGEIDSTVPVQRSRDMVKALKDAGWEVKYTECPGVGHPVWNKTFDGDAVWAWLFAQKR
jgi:predicted peptidase